MPRKLKVFETSQGFFDLAIAAPSMKAALESLGANSNLFHQGAAKESEDEGVVAAAMAKPGIVLRRPIGSDAAFREHAELPSAASLDAAREQPSRKALPRNRQSGTKNLSARPRQNTRRKSGSVKSSARRKRPRPANGETPRLKKHKLRCYEAPIETGPGYRSRQVA
jgi:hypothetical protein